MEYNVYSLITVASIALCTWMVELDPSVMDPNVNVREMALVSIRFMLVGFPKKEDNDFDFYLVVPTL